MSDIQTYPSVNEHPRAVPCSLVAEDSWVKITVTYPTRRSKRLKAHQISDAMLRVPLHSFGHGRRESE